MAERRATNKYYPPEWEPEHGSINRFVKYKGNLPPTTTLRSGVGQTQDIIVNTKQEVNSKIRRIRFELPQPIWCGGCGRHIAKNVRFNADKQQTGMYHSTPILQFKFKCPSCPQLIVVESDPANTAYKVVSGGKSKIETPDDHISADVEPQEIGPFAQLEETLEKEKKAAEEKPRMERLERSSVNLWENDFIASRIARKKFRDEKKLKVKDPVGEALSRYGLSPDAHSTSGEMSTKRNKKEFKW